MDKYIQFSLIKIGASMSKQPIQTEERRFDSKSAASIFGAPVSWVALYGALIGALSIVPYIFYSTGTGFTSAGMAIFGPISGIILGPWAGLVAGTIGGVVGMMISPAAYPLGFVDVILSGSLLPLYWGLFAPKFYKWLLVFVPINFLLYYFVPYYWPGVGDTVVSEPAYFISRNMSVVHLAVFFLFGKKIMHMMESPTVRTHIFGLVGVNFLACAAWILPWSWPYALLFQEPIEQTMFVSTVAWVEPAAPVVIGVTVISFFLIKAVRKGNLRVVKDSWLDTYNFQIPI